MKPILPLSKDSSNTLQIYDQNRKIFYKNPRCLYEYLKTDIEINETISIHERKQRFSYIPVPLNSEILFLSESFRPPNPNPSYSLQGLLPKGEADHLR
jgi:hypothetical protein